MIYTIKAIPTVYNHVQFRSRLEARWAAFFDLCGWKWDYEPFDLDGWAPDFLLRSSVGPVLCEVKPYDAVDKMVREMQHGGSVGAIDEYAKAHTHAGLHQVLLLGFSPIIHDRMFPIGFPTLPPKAATYSYQQAIDALCVEDMEDRWVEAGNVVQWTPSRRRAA